MQTAAEMVYCFDVLTTCFQPMIQSRTAQGASSNIIIMLRILILASILRSPEKNYMALFNTCRSGWRLDGPCLSRDRRKRKEICLWWAGVFHWKGRVHRRVRMVRSACTQTTTYSKEINLHSWSVSCLCKHFWGWICQAVDCAVSVLACSVFLLLRLCPWCFHREVVWTSNPFWCAGVLPSIHISGSMKPGMVSTFDSQITCPTMLISFCVSPAQPWINNIWNISVCTHPLVTRTHISTSFPSHLLAYKS